MIHSTPEGFKYYESLDEAKADGHILIPCNHVLQFFKIKDRRTILEKNNLIPIPNLQYLLNSKQENRFYVKNYPGYSVDEIFFYYKDKNAEVNESIESLMNQVSAGNITLLFNKDMVTDMKSMLLRIWKSKYTTEGTLKYEDYIPVLSEILRFEDFKDNQNGVTGYKTVCEMFNVRINEMWMAIRMKNLKAIIPK
jgi:hypothetical protein